MIEEAWAAEYTYLGIIVDTEAIRKLQVRVAKAILTTQIDALLA